MSETEKDNKELEIEKLKFIKEIKTLNKEQLFKKEELTFWKRLRKVFLGK